MFMRGFLSGQGRADQKAAQEEHSRNLEIERARQDDAQGRAALQQDRETRRLSDLVGFDATGLDANQAIGINRQMGQDQMAAAQRDQEAATRRTQAQYNLSRALQMNAGNPQVTAMLRAQAQRMGVDLGGSQVQIEGEQPIAIPAGQNELRGLEAGALVEGAKPEAATDDPYAKPNTDQLDYAKILSSKGLDPRDPKNWTGYERYLDQQTKARASVTNVNMPGGGAPPTVAGQTQQQGEVLKAQRRLFQLNAMKKAIADAGGSDAITQYTAEGGVIAKTLAKVGMANKEDKAAIKRRSKAAAAIGGFTDPIISELSGANVPPDEMKRIVQSLPTINDAGPELDVKIAVWEDNLRLIERFGIDYLVNGIRTGAVALPGEDNTKAHQDAASEYDRNKK
jgi:hypothetical protein